MSMVYGFVKQSGGGVLRSRQARGTSVALLLPRTRQMPRGAESPTNRHRARTARATGAAGGDNPEVRKVARLLLTDLGYPVLEAENALKPPT